MVEEAVEECPIELRLQFRAMQDSYIQIDCKRSESVGLEKMYAVMMKGQNSLLFDDVEDAFCAYQDYQKRQEKRKCKDGNEQALDGGPNAKLKQFQGMAQDAATAFSDQGAGAFSTAISLSAGAFTPMKGCYFIGVLGGAWLADGDLSRTIESAQISIATFIAQPKP